MTLVANYDADQDVIVIEFNGAVNREVIFQYVETVLSFKSEFAGIRILMDLRQAIFDFSTVELYYLPEILSDRGLKKSYRTALLVAGHFEDFHFYETVAINRGFQVKIFMDYIQAVEWLKKE